MSTNYYYLAGHQHKGIPYKKALNAEGWVRTVDKKKAQIALFDHVTNHHTEYWGKYRAVVQPFADAGCAIVNYPHAAILPWWLDGLMQVPSELDLLLVISEEYKRLTQNFVGVPIYSTGFPYCEVLPFVSRKSRKTVRRILFAPVHPSRLGKLRSECYITNRNVHRELKRLQNQLLCKVTIRYLYDMESQGIGFYKNFEYVQATPDGGTREIDKADIVIAEGTMLHIAVARGKAVVALNQEHPVRPNASKVGWKADHWDDYSEQIAYPINYRKGKLLELIEEAMEGNKDIREWKKKYVGDNMQSEEFATKMASVWEERKKKNYKHGVIRTV